LRGREGGREVGREGERREEKYHRRGEKRRKGKTERRDRSRIVVVACWWAVCSKWWSEREIDREWVCKRMLRGREMRMRERTTLFLTVTRRRRRRRRRRKRRVCRHSILGGWDTEITMTARGAAAAAAAVAAAAEQITQTWIELVPTAER